MGFGNQGLQKGYLEIICDVRRRGMSKWLGLATRLPSTSVLSSGSRVIGNADSTLGAPGPADQRIKHEKVALTGAQVSDVRTGGDYSRYSRFGLRVTAPPM